MMRTPSVRKHGASCEQGFTLIEALISMFVLTIGLLTLAGVVGLAMASTQSAHEDMIAKQLANEAMESIFAARDSSQNPWASINNVSNGGIFMDLPQAINLPGADGVIGTADDGPAQVLHEPGPDGIIGTADDVNEYLTNFQRTIAIVPVVLNGLQSATLRQVNITIQYTTPQNNTPKTYVLSGYISEYH